MIVAASGAALAFYVQEGDGRSGEAETAPEAIALQPVEVAGSSMRVTWTGPSDLDYAVEITAEGQATSTLLAGRATTLTAEVQPDVDYCFRASGTDGTSVVLSDVQSVRGAPCAE